jgi:transglutaminase-like putative cysteine protease
MKTPPSNVSMRMYNILPRPTQFNGYQVGLLVLHIVAQWIVWMQIAVAGWALDSTFLPWVAAVITVIMAVVIWYTNDDSTPMYGAVAIIGVVIICWQLEPIIVADISNTLGPDVASRLNGYGDTISEIALHAIRWWRLTMQGESAQDMVLFVAALALLCLSITMTTTWILFRLQLAWVSIICTGVPLLINHTFVPQADDTVIMVFVLIAILMVVVNHITVRHTVWQALRVDHPVSTPLHVLWQAIVLLVPIIVLAMVLPLPASNERILSVWQALRSPFTTVRTSWETVFGNGGVDVAGGFSQSAISVAGARDRSEQVVMRVQTTHRDYLRATSFDTYTGAGWQRLSDTTVYAIPAGVAIPNTNTAAVIVRSQVTLTRPRNDNLLMSVGTPATYGVDAEIVVMSGFDINNNGMYAVQSNIIQNSDTTYTMTSLLSYANENELRSAPVAPDEINTVYLQLPNTLPERITAFTRTLVAQADARTQYDKTIAIQQYLRTLTYDESRPRPPTSMDWVEYILFESQRGYCDDFATAMVVMLRTQGIPARFVQGYVLSDRDPIRGDYVVRESLAHSWVEVYFSGYGWLRFEPTPTGYTSVPDRAAPVAAAPTVPPTPVSPANDPADSRPTPTRDLSQFEPNDDARTPTPSEQSPWWSVLVALLLGSASVGALWYWWQQRSALQRFMLHFRVMRTVMHSAGLAIDASTTANELSQLATTHLGAVARPVAAMCHAYNEILFANRVPSDWPVMPWWQLVHTCAHYRWQQLREGV